MLLYPNLKLFCVPVYTVFNINATFIHLLSTIFFRMDKYSYIANAHGAYIDELYKSYKADPESVDPSWQKFFEGFDFSQQHGNGAPIVEEQTSTKETKVRNYIHAWRTRGHLESITNPVRKRRDRKALLSLSDHGLSEADMDESFNVGKEIGIGRATLREIDSALKKIYAGTIGFEYMFIREPDILDWFKRKIEYESLNFNPTIDEKKRILEKINEAVVFENFLHTKYMGQKRFSLEGGETTIPALDAIINKSADYGVEEVVIGMAHRGRLNILANIMGKTYGQILHYNPEENAHFEDDGPEMGGDDAIVPGNGDDTFANMIESIGRAASVKVHTAASGKVKYASAHDLRRGFGHRWAQRVMPAVLKELMRHDDISTTMKYYAEQDAAAIMKAKDINIVVRVGDGPGLARFWTSDLSHAYVSINADYRT